MHHKKGKQNKALSLMQHECQKPFISTLQLPWLQSSNQDLHRLPFHTGADDSEWQMRPFLASAATTLSSPCCCTVGCPSCPGCGRCPSHTSCSSFFYRNQASDNSAIRKQTRCDYFHLHTQCNPSCSAHDLLVDDQGDMDNTADETSEGLIILNCGEDATQFKQGVVK